MMVNKSKAVGTEWETRLVEYLRPRFGNCERLTLNGSLDEGDLYFYWNDLTFVIEAKAERAINLASYMKEAAAEAGNFAKKRPMRGKPFGVAIVKRRNHGVDKAYVVMELDTFVRMVKE